MHPVHVDKVLVAVLFLIFVFAASSGAGRAVVSCAPSYGRSSSFGDALPPRRHYLILMVAGAICQSSHRLLWSLLMPARSLVALPIDASGACR